jgi:hypothetical protein
LSTNIIYNFTALEDLNLTAKFSEEITSDIQQEDEIIYGDADADGKLTVQDAEYTLKKVKDAGFELPIQNKTQNWLQYIDVNADGILTAEDAAYIYHKAYDTGFEFPAEAIN